ncbi:hypothetical protein [Thalassobacillus pellis]|uniref:hypothetical protein n=1 Tax=Thalassobacillus pellis TaxID=748008 RepID=UPI001961470B|nr:hypothetical protein [Thalassobacillus pellis]MBM7554900.1 hypothetical protein [Thalassobacillus pellis]
MREQETEITVVDSIMGSGKTSWALQYINESNEDMRFIYITPYLNEVERVRKTVNNRTFHTPNNANYEGRKLRSLKELVVSGHDICATHSLFQTADDELLELLIDAGYTLILDEVMNVIEKAPLSQSDIKTLNKGENIVTEGNSVKWINEEYNDGRFSDIKRLAKAGNLLVHREKFFLWALPAKIFEAFDDVFVLTYLFDAQIQRYYYDLHGISYRYKSVTKNDGSYQLKGHDSKDENRTELMKLIDLYEGPLNEVGKRPNAFSATWLRNTNTIKRERIKKDLYNYLRNQRNAKSHEILWTTIKDVKDKVKGRGYAKSFASCNLRATNEYQDRHALAFLYNRYLNPLEQAFFQDNGVRINQELLAVSDLIQWVWRSRIRNNEPISLFLPSSRMRKLLKKWAAYEI